MLPPCASSLALSFWSQWPLRRRRRIRCDTAALWWANSAPHAVGPRGRSPHRSAPPFHALGRSFDLDDFPRLLVRGISATHPDMPEIRFNEDDARAVRDYLRTIQH